MEVESTNKKRLFYIIVLVLTLIVMIIGATMAYYSLIASQKEEGTKLYTGTLEISYVDGTRIKNPDLYPLSNVNYQTMEHVYRNNFSVKSTGTLDQTITIDLEVSKNEFTDNALKYAVYNNNGTELENGYVPKSGTFNLASNVYLEHGTSATYTIIIWWDNTNYDQKVDSGHQISGKIIAYAKQIKY